MRRARHRAGDGVTTPGERLRVIALFATLGVAAAALLVRVAVLQLHPGRNALAARAAARQHVRTELSNAPRGPILARDGRPLAYDRPVCEVRVEAYLEADREPRDGQSYRATDFGTAAGRLVERLVWALGKDPRRADAPVRADRLRKRLGDRVDARLQRLERQAQLGRSARVDLLVDRSVDSAAVLQALRSLERPRTSRGRRGSTAAPRLTVHVLDRYERVYPEGEVTAGLVGTVRAASVPHGTDRHGAVLLDRFGVSGLERLRLLTPRDRGARTLRVNATGDRSWTAAVDAAEEPAAVHTTIDVRLQRTAVQQLERAVEEVEKAYGSPPDWGALVLVEVETGGLLAMAGWLRGPGGRNNPHGSFAPTQLVFEPGSIVKPLHMALGIERGVYDWSTVVDCSPGYLAGQEYAQGRRLPRRPITDSHVCGELTPRGVLVNSSNIGAVQLGLRLGADGIEEYLQRFEYGVPTGLLLPGESAGRRPDPIPGLSRNKRLVWAGPSVCFGYELHTTTVQIARAFLTLLSGRPERLQVVRGYEVDGAFRPHRPVDEPGERFLSASTIARTTEALVAVAHGDEGSTARALADWLDREQVPYGTFAGKTGTSEYRGAIRAADGSVVREMIRTASFAGFAPAAAPRFLVVCVLQKVGAASFYGGRYAAPAAGRLLLSALLPTAGAFRVADPGGSAPVPSQRSGALGSR